MSQEKTTVESSVVAVYHDQKAAEHALRQLHEAGFATSDLSIVGRDFQMSEQPIGFISAGDYASAGAAAGTWFGGLFGLCVGAAFLVLPGLGPVVIAGPLATAILAGIEGAIAGTALGSLGGGAHRLGDTQGTGSQVRDQRQGGQIPRDRTRRAAGHCPGPRIARSPACGSYRSFRWRQSQRSSFQSIVLARCNARLLANYEERLP